MTTVKVLTEDALTIRIPAAVNAAVGASPTVVAAATAAVTAALVDRGAVLSSTLGPSVGASAFAIVDSAGRAALTIAQDGTVAAAKLTVPAGAVDAAQLTPAVLSGLNQTAGGAESGYAWSVVDLAGHVSIGIRPDGTFDILKAGSGGVGAATITAEKLAPAVAARLLPVQTGAIHAVGDSLTAAGSGYGTLLAAEIGQLVVVNAIGGQGVEQIAARQGGAQVGVSLSGNTIPASGAAGVSTAFRPYGAAGPLSGAGSIAGVPGVLSDDGAGAQLFNRTAPGAAVWVAPGTRWIPDVAVAQRTSVLIIGAGRNSFTTMTPDAIVGKIAQMAGYCREAAGRFLVLEVYPASNEPLPAAAGSAREKLNLLNAALAAAFPNEFVPLNAYLQARALTDMAITQTAQDTTDIAAGVTPTSLRADGIHLNVAGNTAIARYLARILRQKGWFA